MDSSDLEPCKRTFTVHIEAVVSPHVLESPAFRFRFLEPSRRIVTPGISTWALAPTSSDHSEDAVENQTSSSQSQARRFTHTFTDVSVTEAFAYSLHADPTIAFFLFDHPAIATLASGTAGSVTTGAKEAKGTKGASSADSVTPRSASAVHRAFAGLFEVDVSCLLGSKRLSVEHTWVSPGGDSAGEHDKVVGFFESERRRKREQVSREAHFACLFELPSTVGALQYLTIRVSVDAPLLTGALLKKLNPITITIGTCRPLPGVIGSKERESEQSLSPHQVLTQFCRPAYVRLAFFPDKLQPSVSLGKLSSSPRVVLTPGKRQAESITWNCSMTFLSSAFDTTTLVDALHSGVITVEIHDRDLKQQSMIQRLSEKWEALYHGESGSSSSHIDVFAIDTLALADWRAVIAQARRFFAYGVAAFQLNQLLHRTLNAAKHELSTSDEPYMTVKLSSDVVPMKRRASTLGSPPSQSPEVEDVDDDKKKREEEDIKEERLVSSAVNLTPLERSIREPGAYVSRGTSLSISVQLQCPLPLPIEAAIRAARAQVRPRTVTGVENNNNAESVSGWKFARMVIIFPFKDSDGSFLDEIARAMESVNIVAVPPDVSLRSYQLTAVERSRAETGELDIITGVQIIDSDFRMIILEGIADKGMSVLNERLIRLRKAPNADGYKLFANSDVRFTSRLYSGFDVDLKRIKLRSALPALLSTPNIYMRPKVSENCFFALTKLADLRACECLVDAKALDLFPTAPMLLEVESKYGESITLEDIYGLQHNVGPVEVLRVNATSAPGMDALEIAISTKRSQSRSRSPLKAPTDSHNTAFEETRRHREVKDYLREQRKQAEQAKAEFTAKRELEQQQMPWTGPVYMYSGQKLRTQDALQDEMRERLAMAREKKKDATYYTYSREFQSLALSLVNPDAVRVKEQQESRAKWTTTRGFVYPAPRDPSEYNKHRDAPSAARCEELHQPFVDNANHPKPVSRGNEGDLDGSGRHLSTLPSKDMIFGGTNGDGSINHEYFRSVHLCGEGLRREMEEARRNEREEWERKLVVDKTQLKFLAHGNSCSEPTKPTQLDKITDILDGPAKSKPLRIVKNASLPSGKRVPLETAPVTILNQDEYIGCVSATFASTLRPKDPSGFVSHDERTGQPRDFLFPSTTDILTPQVKKFTTRKEIAPVPASEKCGLLWKNQ